MMGLWWCRWWSFSAGCVSVDSVAVYELMIRVRGILLLAIWQTLKTLYYENTSRSKTSRFLQSGENRFILMLCGDADTHRKKDKTHFKLICFPKLFI